MFGWLRARFRGGAAAPAPLVIELDGQRLTFGSPAEFGSMLQPRLEVSASLLRLLAKETDDELRSEVTLTRAVHRKLTHGLLRSLEIGTDLSAVWREMDLSKIHEEHQWQALLYALADELHTPDAYRRVALAKYLQYLNARREVLGDVLRERERANARQTSNEPRDEVRDEARAAAAAAARPEPLPGRAVDEITYTSMQRSSEFSRLPPRHPVDLVLAPGDTVTLFLAHRRMHLVVKDEGAVLTDDTGLAVPIHEGRMVVGRSAECDVVLRDAPGDVSRRHLLIESGPQELRLTDLSSHGTYVIKRVLPHTQTRH